MTALVSAMLDGDAVEQLAKRHAIQATCHGSANPAAPAWPADASACRTSTHATEGEK